MQSASMDAKPPLLFYLSTNATQQHTCFTHWTERILSALAKHPWRTKSRSKADVLFLPSLETRFELNFPLFTGPRLAYRHYDARLCDRQVPGGRATNGHYREEGERNAVDLSESLECGSKSDGGDSHVE